MPALETDQEQMEMLKRWWNEYGKLVLLVIIIGLGIGFGWRYWLAQQSQNQQKASLLYQQLLEANRSNNNEVITQISNEINHRYQKTEYANMANLFAAKAVLPQNPEVALKRLQSVMNNSKMPSLKQVARLRAARILAAQKKMQAGLDLLNKVDDRTYQPLIDEVKGDIYAIMGDQSKARQLYQSAQVGLSAIVGEDMLLSLELAGG